MLNLFRNRLRRLMGAAVGTKRRHRSGRRRNSQVVFESLESRVLLSNVNLIPAAGGQLFYSGSAAANTLTISYDSALTRYTFADSEAIAAIGGLAGFDLDPSANTLMFDVTAVAAFNRMTLNPAGGDDNVTVSSFRPGVEGFEMQDAAGQGTDSLTINGNIGNAGSRTTRPVTLRGETINVGAGIFTANQTVSVTNLAPAVGNLTLTGNVTLDAGAGSVHDLGQR